MDSLLALSGRVHGQLQHNDFSMPVKFFRWVSGISRIFLLTVVVPTLASGIYFSVLASDVYVSESRFMVRSAHKTPSAALGGLLEGVGISRSSDDVFAVHDFIQSRDALHELERRLGVSRSFGDPNVDRLSRFAGLDGDKSFESLHRYYLHHVTVSVDGASAISVLRTSAFSPDVAERMNDSLLRLSESLVNGLNERSRLDTIRFAAAELESAESRAKTAAAALAAFRNDKVVFDPERQSALQLQLISKLQDELIATKTQLAQVRDLTRDSPQIRPLQIRLDALQREIDSETKKIVGNKQSLSSKSASYSVLELDRVLADKQLAAALTAIEQARSDSLRKQLYLERIVQPSLPDKALEPRRLRNVLSTFLLGMIIWGIASLLLAGIREHHG